MKKLLRILLVLLAAVFFLPALATVLLSFLPEGQAGISGYDELFFDCFQFYTMFWNSVTYAYLITALQLVVILPAAFAFSFAKFRGKELLFFFYIILMMMPLQVMLLPNYIGLRGMKLLNTPFAIILPLFFSPLAVVILYQYLRECDVQVVDAARLETNSVLRVMINCILPQIRVCLFAVGLLIFSETWNLVEQPLLYLDEEKWKNLSLLFSEAERYDGEILLPAAVVFMIPVFLWYLLFHRELREGLKL